MSNLSAHFTSEEFTCHCGCGLCRPHPRLIAALETLRKSLGNLPVTVNCGTRCAARNQAIGGAPRSQHVPENGAAGYSLAADIKAQGRSSREIYDAAVEIPDFARGGIGVYQSDTDSKKCFVHLDVRDGPARWGMHNGEDTTLVLALHAADASATQLAASTKPRPGAGRTRAT